MLAHFYSIKELDRSIRTSFEIPTDPYDKSAEEQDRAMDYLRSLGIFFYRDEENVNGIVMEVEDGVSESIFDRKGFQGFKHLVELDPRTFSPEPWERPDRAKIEKEGDDRAWLHFNASRYIEAVSEVGITTGVVA